MGIFDTKKKSSIIKNEEILSYEYVPKLLPYRENQVKEIANSIKPLFEEQKGTNLFIHGAPGIGKTASIRWVLRELNETADDVIPLYINCWNYQTKYFVLSNLAEQLNVTFTSGRGAEHILQQIAFKLKDKKAVFVFDEIDRIEDISFLYQIIEMFPLSCVHLISNTTSWLLRLDPRIKSRLMLRTIEFKPYNIPEINGIIKDRAKLALRADSINPSFLKQISVITHSKKDIRIGLYLLREAAKLADADSRRKIQEKDIRSIIKQLDGIMIGEEEKLNIDETRILESVKETDGEIASKIFEKYEKKGGKLSYKSFKRYVKRLGRLGLLKLEATGPGFKGKSTKIFLVNKK